MAERFDIGVRLGGDVAKDMVAVRMAPDMRLVVVGSPDHFRRHARPRTPQDLTGHDGIGLHLPSHGGLLPWEFQRRGKSLNGHGLAWVPDDAVAEPLAQGRLVSVLDDGSQTLRGYHACWATRSASPALGLVVEASRQEIQPRTG